MYAHNLNAFYLFLRWPGGYVAAASSNEAPPPKVGVAKPAAAKRAMSNTGRRTQVEKYSTSYSSVGCLPVHSSGFYLSFGFCTRVFLNKLSRDAHLSFVFLATGLLPTDKLPSQLILSTYGIAWKDTTSTELSDKSEI